MTKFYSERLSYPNMDGVKKDVSEALIITNAFCGEHGESEAVYRYACRYVDYIKLNDIESAKIACDILTSELQHLSVLFTLIEKLGINAVKVSPEKHRLTRTKPIEPCVKKMLLDDLTVKLSYVEEYKRIIYKLKDGVPKKIIQLILVDEQRHAQILSERYYQLKGKKQ